ncbi:unnamed protein product [Paramecium sonneborni]|uniref:Uncharacterized protein n=1 Tax=Paramecium sonneborni TaxID=65129 RepID=A0A8S1P5L4_9CILI|nr:unnamed protein product [Paramecium sonneborni]
MGCAPSVLNSEKCEINYKDDIIFSDDFEMVEETCANLINNSIQVNQSVLNKKTFYQDDEDDVCIVQQQLQNQKPFTKKSCLKKNDRTQKIDQKEKKVRFCKTYQIFINGVKIIFKKKNKKKRQKQYQKSNQYF